MNEIIDVYDGEKISMANAQQQQYTKLYYMLPVNNSHGLLFYTNQSEWKLMRLKIINYEI